MGESNVNHETTSSPSNKYEYFIASKAKKNLDVSIDRMIRWKAIDQDPDTYYKKIEYYSQFNKKLCGTKQVENFYINIIRSISSILNIHGNHHVNDNNNNIHTQNLNEAKPLHVMLDFIKRQKEVDVNSKLTEEILLKYLKIGSELFQKHVRCVESTYVCVRCLCVYI